MKFGEVLDGLQAGQRFTRPSWPAPAYIVLLPTAKEPILTSVQFDVRFQYIAVYTGNRVYKVFFPDTDDLFATDWERY